MAFDLKSAQSVDKMHVMANFDFRATPDLDIHDRFSNEDSQIPAHLSKIALVRWVNLAFKQYHSVFALSRLPLANAAVIAPALVLDPVSPTADERGQALRLVLRWAVTQLAPGPIPYPLGDYRPLDDPTWRDPLWWRYNILTYRYLNPLHPDDFIDGGRFTETLLSLTGIPTADTFFQERNRAIREVAERLRQQMGDGAANETLRQMALDEIYRPLQANPAAHALLGIATTFDDVFPRQLLLQMAHNEHLTGVEAALAYLCSQRFLLTGDNGAALWISPILRGYVYTHQTVADRQRRHRQVARYFEEQGEPLAAAVHCQRAGQWPQAAEILLAASESLITELQLEELREALLKFRAETLSPGQWREIQIVLVDLYRRTGQRQEALTACRRALKGINEPRHQARLYRRLGKLYEMHNQLHALAYYQQAAERFTADDTEFLDLLKDRAWLYILRKEWHKAQNDLSLALAHAGQDAVEARADIYDALASLHRHQKQYEPALTYAQQALVLREETGDLLRVAKGLGNLGLLYQETHDYHNAIAAHEEAMSVYQRLGNQELTATALLNIGMAYHLDGRLSLAIDSYNRSLALCQQIGYPLVEVKARSNLAEAWAQRGVRPEAERHWQAGYTLSIRSGFEDQIQYFEDLRQAFPILTGVEARPAALDSETTTASLLVLDAEAQAALSRAEREGRVTTRDLMEETGVSKATATRRLTDMVDGGYLLRHGQGRGTYYTLPPTDTAGLASPDLARRREFAGDETPGDLEGLRHDLLSLSGRLHEVYRVDALGIVTAQQPRQHLRAHFYEMPTVEQFFELEAFLSEQAGCAIDLKPVSSLANQTESILWFWHPTEMA